MFTGFVAIFIFPTVKDGIITNKRSIINYLLKEQTAETQATLYLLLRIRVV